MTGTMPPSHAEPNTASRRMGREAMSPALRLEYMKPNTAMAVRAAMMNAANSAASQPDSSR